MKYKKYIFFLIVLALLAPAGLLLPAFFKAGSAWGEWGSDELKDLVGFVPRGFARLEGIWNPLIPDYNIPGWNGSLFESIGYILSGMIGIAAVIGVGLLLGKLLSTKEENGD